MNDPALVRKVQAALVDAGHDALEIDGVFGPATQAALADFQLNNSIVPTGLLDAETRALLFDERRSNPFEDFALRIGLKLLLNKLFPGKDINVDTVLATVKSAWASKLNWTMAVGVIFNVLMLFGHPVPEDIQTQVYALGNSAVLVVGWIIKTWFTTSITAASAKKL